MLALHAWVELIRSSTEGAAMGLNTLTSAGAWASTRYSQEAPVTPTTTDPADPPDRAGEKLPRILRPDEMAELEEGIRAVGCSNPSSCGPCRAPTPTRSSPVSAAGAPPRTSSATTMTCRWSSLDASDETAEAMSVIENPPRRHVTGRGSPRRATPVAAPARRQGKTARLMGWSPEVLERRLALMACTPTVLKGVDHAQHPCLPRRTVLGIPEKQDSVLAGVLAQKVPVAVLKAQLGRFARRWLADAIFDTAQCSGCTQ